MEMIEFFKFAFEQREMIWKATGEHIFISLLSVMLGIAVSVPLGVFLTRRRKIANIVLGVTGIIQTIPSIVLFGLALPVLGLGFLPAFVVLFLYSILPILRNTYTGICEVEGKYIEAAKGMGMNSFQVLYKVELPLALPVIMAGIRLALVYIISWATVAALIGAGGLGDLIWTGLQRYRQNMILAGALPASLLALLAGMLLNLLQKLVIPKGLRNGRV